MDVEGWGNKKECVCFQSMQTLRHWQMQQEGLVALYATVAMEYANAKSNRLASKIHSKAGTSSLGQRIKGTQKYKCKKKK